MKPILLDIMLERGKFYRQIKYTKRGFPEMIDGKVLEVHDLKDFREYAEEKYPSLKNRKYYIQLSNQKV